MVSGLEQTSCACTHTDLHNVMTSDAVAMVEDMVPDRKSMATVRAKAYGELEDYLLANKSWALPSNHKADPIVFSYVASVFVQSQGPGGYYERIGFALFFLCGGNKLSLPCELV